MNRGSNGEYFMFSGNNSSMRMEWNMKCEIKKYHFAYTVLNQIREMMCHEINIAEKF